MSVIEFDYGKSVKIEDSDGSIVWKDGDIQMVEGIENVAQRLSYALSVEYGADQFNPIYGIDRYAIFGAELDLEDQVELAKMQVKRSLMEDDQVNAIPEIEFEEIDVLHRLYNFIIKVEVIGGQSFAIDLEGVPI